MQLIITIFSIISIISGLIVLFVLYKKLPTAHEKLKLIVPILIGLVIGIVFCLIGMHPPTCEFGRFM